MGCEECRCKASRRRVASLLAVLAHREMPASKAESLVSLVVENEQSDLMVPGGIWSWADETAERIFDD